MHTEKIKQRAFYGIIYINVPRCDNEREESTCMAQRSFLSLPGKWLGNEAIRIMRSE